jgi:hypothetical protein
MQLEADKQNQDAIIDHQKAEHEAWRMEQDDEREQLIQEDQRMHEQAEAEATRQHEEEMQKREHEHKIKLEKAKPKPRPKPSGKK